MIRDSAELSSLLYPPGIYTLPITEIRKKSEADALQHWQKLIDAPEKFVDKYEVDQWKDTVTIGFIAAAIIWQYGCIGSAKG